MECVFWFEIKNSWWSTLAETNIAAENQHLDERFPFLFSGANVRFGVGGCTLQGVEVVFHLEKGVQHWKITFSIRKMCEKSPWQFFVTERWGGSIKPWISKFFATCFGDNFDFCESFALFLAPFSKFDFQWRHKKTGRFVGCLNQVLCDFWGYQWLRSRATLPIFFKGDFPECFFLGFRNIPSDAPHNQIKF